MARGRPGSAAVADGLTYREYPPPGALAGVIECFWRREPWRPPTRDLGVLPDGRLDLIWASNGDVLVIGPQMRPLRRPLPPRVVVIGVRFRPGAGPALLGVSAHELADTHVPLEAIDARRASSLRQDLWRIEDATFAPARLARAVARRVDPHCSSLDAVVRRAAALLGDPAMRVERIAAELEFSERQLERRFREAVGYGPKMLQRVLRFQRLLAALQLSWEQPSGLASIAAATGYSDQAHLTREAREFSGLSPVHLKRTLGALKDEGALGIFKTGWRRTPPCSVASTSVGGCPVQPALETPLGRTGIVSDSFKTRLDSPSTIDLVSPAAAT
jgi:AraC-like DNA-binding protein